VFDDSGSAVHRFALHRVREKHVDEQSRSRGAAWRPSHGKAVGNASLREAEPIKQSGAALRIVSPVKQSRGPAGLLRFARNDERQQQTAKTKQNKKGSGTPTNAVCFSPPRHADECCHSPALRARLACRRSTTALA
jgi:hypothetical protein